MTGEQEIVSMLENADKKLREKGIMVVMNRVGIKEYDGMEHEYLQCAVDWENTTGWDRTSKNSRTKIMDVVEQIFADATEYMSEIYRIDDNWCMFDATIKLMR